MLDFDHPDQRVLQVQLPSRFAMNLMPSDSVMLDFLHSYPRKSFSDRNPRANDKPENVRLP